jgi:hypothetical protein
VILIKIRIVGIVKNAASARWNMKARLTPIGHGGNRLALSKTKIANAISLPKIIEKFPYFALPKKINPMQKDNLVYLTYITLSIYLFAILLICFFDQYILFLPFVVCLAAFLGFFAATIHLHYRWYLSNSKLYRKWKKGYWHYYSFTGQLPGLFGGMWTQESLADHRFYKKVKTEYNK